MSEQKRIPIIPCESTWIAGYGWDEETQTLAVQYRDRAGKPASVYYYQNVTADVYRALEDAPSKGAFLRVLIQAKDDDGNSRYPAVKLADEP